MRKLILPISLILLLASFENAPSYKTEPLTVTWKFVNIVEGYDHDTRCDVYIDGVMEGSSTTTLESQQNSMTLQVPAGLHQIRVINLALYEGEWEEHSIENEYRIDCYFDGEREFGKKNRLFLLFDIDYGTTFSWKKMPKAEKSKKTDEG